MKRRKIFKKTPSGVKVVYKRRKPSKHKCANCRIELPGVKSLINSKMHNMARSKKKVQRKYGGNLCSKCSREKIIQEFKK